ncbi:phosphatase PAP2 family protein [Halodesulfurarchaeum sp.]|uniref:phosphatase PAP2 family protein n=1 Tax=Halodesulfurarchaeum sp. TaxID=1980530 RepID=UPI002FC3835C
MDHLLQELVQFVLRIDAMAVDIVVELRRPLFTKVMNSVTGLGSASAGLVFLGLFYLADWHREFKLTLAALILSGVIVGSLMLLVQRPYPPQPVCLTGGAETIAHSFPSGHAAAVSVYAMVAHRSKILPFVITTSAAILIAFSRFYLGTHYLSDTVFGVLIGIGAVLVAERMLDSDRLPISY